jgi:hypothetical protein
MTTFCVVARTAAGLVGVSADGHLSALVIIVVRLPGQPV